LIFPELAILISVLIQIQAKTMAGIFDFSLYDYESFTEALNRKEKNMLKHDEEF
jgi:hypothetical protein